MVNRKKDETRKVKKQEETTPYRKALKERMAKFRDEHRFRAAKVASWLQSEEDLDEDTTNKIYETLLEELREDSDPFDVRGYEILKDMMLNKKVKKVDDNNKIMGYISKVVELLKRHEGEYVMSLLMIVANSYSSDVVGKYTDFVNAVKAEVQKKSGVTNNTTKIGKRKK